MVWISMMDAQSLFGLMDLIVWLAVWGAAVLSSSMYRLLPGFAGNRGDKLLQEERRVAPVLESPNPAIRGNLLVGAGGP